VAVRGAHGYQLQVPPIIDNCLTSGSGGKHKNSDDYDGGRRRHRDSVMSRGDSWSLFYGTHRDSVMSRGDSWSLFYGDGEVDRDGYTHIWERPLPGAPPSSNRQQHHVTAAAMLVPAGQSDCTSCSESLVYKCRGGTGQGPPPPPLPPPVAAMDVTSPSSSCQDAVVDLPDYHQLDAKDGDQSPHAE